ncbi:MAG: hypothetical protein INQ03_23975 [Candidatus Heimdallarchaeota archaeon]|nr:hypothetical protein [Candidatus Heimdallarchaeota archaeon]
MDFDRHPFEYQDLADYLHIREDGTVYEGLDLRFWRYLQYPEMALFYAEKANSGLELTNNPELCRALAMKWFETLSEQEQQDELDFLTTGEEKTVL